ncbi:MAG: low molecular weight protein-tyrosine-phosphatase [Rikenellaceae bacterium]
MKQRILFVCLGNICRSPAAEGVLRAYVEREGLEGEFEIDSAGTYGGHAGDAADPRMRQAAFVRGYHLTHRSRQIEEDDFRLFDRIIVMDDNNYRNVERLAPSPEAKAKIERFVDLCRHHPDAHYVPDPYYEGREGFERVLDILEDGCTQIIDACRY